MSSTTRDVDHILHSVLVPSFPPNTSQWRKLELAMKFINKSKAEAVRKRSMKIDVRPAVDVSEDCDDEDKELKKTTNTEETELKQPVKTVKAVVGQKKKNFEMLEKRDSFSKLMDSFGKIL